MTLEEVKDKLVGKLTINYRSNDGKVETFKAIDVRFWNNTYVIYFDNKDNYFCSIGCLRDAQGNFLDEVLGI